jgi:VWFA-related protein
MAVKEEATTLSGTQAASFRVNVKLVLARVVVRDSTGHTVGNLHKEDFELFDNGKPQVVSDFDVEHATAQPWPTAVTGTANPTDSSLPAEKQPEFPGRYVAYLFDDLHLSFQNLVVARIAAQHALDGMAATDRAAILSTSGQTTLDFTDDRAKLHQSLNSLMPRPIGGAEVNPCPDISFYQADLIVNKKNPEALQTALNDYSNCANIGATKVLIAAAPAFIQGKASEILSTGEHESRLAIDALGDAIRRLMGMPGQRNLVLVSPGFLTPDSEYADYDVIDHALRAQVVINALDARGLYVTIPGGEASQEGHADIALSGLHHDTPLAGTGYTPASHAVLDVAAASAQDEILSVLAYGTGGTFFHNNNDLDEGFRRLAEAPEYYYILGFTPQSLKTDGKFHTLKVTLKSHPKYDLQARRGYYAPHQAADSAEEAKREIEDEMLSTEELHGLPVTLHTQFFKASDEDAKLIVLAHVDVQHLHFRKVEGRNNNVLTCVSALFNHNGNFVQGMQKVVTMNLKDDTLEHRLVSGITLKTSFDVKPGSYLVRLVVRDAEGQLMSAENGTVEIR